MRYLNTLAVSALLMLGSSAARAVHWDLMYRFCPEELVQVPRFIEDIPIPVGCEVVDCCPGCPGPGILEWRINIDKTMLQGAMLRFEGLTQQNLAQLKIKGNAKLTEKGDIILGTGEISISGLPVEVDGRVPVGFINPQIVNSLDADTQQASQDKAAAGGRNEADISGAIQVVQYLGHFPVNSFRSRFAAIPCRGRPTLPQDRLVLNSNTSADSAIAMLDHRTGGCNNDQITRTAGTANMGNILSKGACRSTVSVFSDDNAMSYQPNVTTWTDSPGDTHTVNLQPVITVPVSVWVANNAQLVIAQNDFANANLLYNQNNTGIQFNPTFNNVSANAAAVTMIGTGCPATAAPLQGSAWYTASRLNIYYVNSAFTGVNCGVDRNMNFIGTTANLGSLPHEIGHAYGLRPSASNGHTNGVAGFGNNNIMWGGGPGTRNHFSVGQAFRLNTDTTSMLNANGNRAGPTETCLPNVSSAICPVLDLDSLPH